jgi:23S rRNA (cytidine2498-2'-O)-methyltransferase
VKAFLAPVDLTSALEEEIKFHRRVGELYLADDSVDSFFAQNTWLDVQEFKFESISQAAKHLRAIQRNWWLHPTAAHRRAQLIHEQLPPLKAKAIEFLAPPPTAPLGSWTLLDEQTLLYAAKCLSPYPDGEVHFVENRTDPPSRAYLKLWEFFTITQKYPKAGERVLDLGSSPGGWTWVLDQLGCEVISVDKAPLSASMKMSDRVHYMEESAFALEPKTVGPIDWLFSDIICYPDRLLSLVKKWMDFGEVRNFVCTIKFQGATDFASIREFLKIPGSRVQHLYANKHELTWSKLN